MIVGVALTLRTDEVLPLGRSETRLKIEDREK
jgi:hypothetical protein